MKMMKLSEINKLLKGEGKKGLYVRGNGEHYLTHDGKFLTWYVPGMFLRVDDEWHVYTQENKTPFMSI